MQKDKFKILKAVQRLACHITVIGEYERMNEKLREIIKTNIRQLKDR